MSSSVSGARRHRSHDESTIQPWRREKCYGDAGCWRTPEYGRPPDRARIRNAPAAPVRPVDEECCPAETHRYQSANARLSNCGKAPEDLAKKVSGLGMLGSDGIVRLRRRNVPETKAMQPEHDFISPTQTDEVGPADPTIQSLSDILRYERDCLDRRPKLVQSVWQAAWAWSGTEDPCSSSQIVFSRLLESIKNLLAQFGY